MRRVVSLFLPTWPTDRWRARNGAAPDRAVLMVSRQGARRLVTAVDASAAGLGLHAGMAVAQAQAMVQDLTLVDADAAADDAALAQLAVWCLRRLSPIVAPCAPDSIWIDVTGCTHLFGGEAAMLHRLTKRLGHAGIMARAALADTPGAAHAVARYAAGAVNVVPAGGHAAALAPLPAAALRLPADTVDGLQRLGFAHIGQLMRTPRAPLARRFGGLVLRRLDQATGAAPEPIEPMSLPDMPRTRQSFPEPISTPDDLARATTLLAQALCEKLLHRGLGASRLDLVFQRVDGAAPALRIGTAAPCRDAAHLTRLLLPGIETIDPGFGVESMLLAASRTDRLGAVQTASSLGAGRVAPDLTLLADMLSSRIGRRNLFRFRPVESDMPERSQARIPALAHAGGATWPERLPRPTRLLDPPVPVTAIALLPDHAPVQFTWRRKAHRICHADGPERVFGEWWKNDSESASVRDYFQVEDEAGQRFWLFRQGDGMDAATGDQHWFLHGVFG